MSNTVQANIEVNAKANTEGFDKVTQAINAINDALKNTQKELNNMSSDKLGGMSVSADMVAESLNRIYEGGSAFKNFQSGLNDTNNELKKTNEEANNSSKSFGDFSNVLVLLGKHFGLSNSEAASFAKALGASATEAAAAGVAIGTIVTILKGLIDITKQSREDLINFGESALEAGVDGIGAFIDTIDTLIDSLTEALEKMEEFAEKGAEIQTAYFNTFTVLGEEAGNEVLDFADKLEHLYGLDGDELVEDMQSVVAAAGSLGVSTDDMVKATENMTVMANDLSILAGSFEKASNDIGNAISKGFVGRNSVLYVLMTKQEKDALKELGSEVERYNYLMALSSRIKGRYVEFLNTEAGQLMLLKAQYGQLVNNISKLVLGLYAKIAPVLTKLIQLANIALTFIMKVFNIDLKGSAATGLDTGSIAEGISDTMKKAGESSKKAEKDISKSTKKAAKSIKELERQVASFDDVIQIKDNKANDDTLGIGDLGDLDDALDNLDDSPIDDLIKDFDLLGDAIGDTKDEFADFKDLLNQGKYGEAGKWLANWLADQLEKIPWDEIQDKAKKAGTAIAEFLNGFNSDKRLWADIGITLGEAMNTVVDFLLNFAKTFDWAKFGDSLALAWNQFWETLDEDEFGDMIYEFFKGVFEFAGKLFENKPLTTMMGSIAKIINRFFSDITEKDIRQMGTTLKNILTDVFDAALELLTSAVDNEPKLIEILKNLISSAKEWLDNGGREKLNEIGDKIVSLIREFNKSGLIKDVGELIREFMKELKWGDIVAEFSKTEIQVWWEKTKTDISETFQIAAGWLDVTIGDWLDDLFNPKKQKNTGGWLGSHLGLGTNDTLELIQELDGAKNETNKALDGLNESINTKITSMEFEGIKVDKISEGVDADINTFKEDTINKLGWLETETNNKINNMNFDSVDLKKVVNIEDIEKRVEAADTKVTELSDIINGLQESSNNLQQIIEELKNSDVINDELKDFIDTVTNNVQTAYDTWSEVEKNALDALILAYSDFLKSIEDTTNSVKLSFSDMATSTSTSVNEVVKNIEDMKNKIEKVLNSINATSAGVNMMNNFKTGLEKGWNNIKQWWNNNVARNITFSFNNGMGVSSGGINIPRLATGGLVTRSTIVNIGEAGREAVLPLDRNTGWMDVLAEKINGGGSNGNVGSVTIDMSKVSKPFYSRSEMIAFGDMCAEAMEARGMRVSRVY